MEEAGRRRRAGRCGRALGECEGDLGRHRPPASAPGVPSTLSRSATSEATARACLPALLPNRPSTTRAFARVLVGAVAGSSSTRGIKRPPWTAWWPRRGSLQWRTSCRTATMIPAIGRDRWCATCCGWRTDNSALAGRLARVVLRGRPLPFQAAPPPPRCTPCSCPAPRREQALEAPSSFRSADARKPSTSPLIRR